MIGKLIIYIHIYRIYIRLYIYIYTGYILGYILSYTRVGVNALDILIANIINI